MIATLTPDLLRVKKPYMVVTLEGYCAKKMHVLVRFGRWRDIIATPLPEDRELYCVTTAMHRYARGVAEAALGNIEAVYRADLGFDGAVSRSCRRPDNVWALHGLAECLHRSGNAAEPTIIRQRLDLALARTDVAIHASCCCRTEIETRERFPP